MICDSSKNICQISNLNKSLMAGNHVYLNCSEFLAPYNPIDEWKIWDSITRSCESRRTEIWKKYKIYILRIRKAKVQDNKIHISGTTWSQEKFFNPTSILHS